jgi:acyl-coenzyme A thioesterase PaaI-like protein
MTIDLNQVAVGMLAAVPFTRTLGLEFVQVTAHGDGFQAVVRLPDAPAHHNHVGGPHAGALFTLGETASGAVVMAAFGHLLGQVTPLAVRAEIAYRRLATGPVLATATLERRPADVIAELDAGNRPEFAVPVLISTEDGTPAAELTVLWTLRPQR